MHFDLRRPCKRCPFRTDCLRGWLGAARAEEIQHGLTDQGSTFACHETTHHDDDGEHIPLDTEQHCAGALILLDKTEGLGTNQMLRIAMGLGIFDPDRLDLDAPVFDTFEDFVEHHGTALSRRPIRGTT